MGWSTHIAQNDTLRLVLFGLAVFLLFYLARDLRINNAESIIVPDETVLFLDEPTDLDGLIGRFADLETEFDESELRWASNLLGWRNFNAGRYEIGGNHSYGELLSRLALGLQDHTPVMIRPGISIERLSSDLGRQLRADSAQFAAIFADTSQLVRDTGLEPMALFSRMLPDTYNIFWTAEPARVIWRILQEFDQRVSRNYSDRLDESRFSLDEYLILASIVEWEARERGEKPRIAGLYFNRLQRNMRLQADPTVIYALGEHRRLLFEDYRIEHPYNTYLIDGLPPGPITNPDIHSIRAVLNPESHNYLYMVASPEGGHVFTETFAEHQVASAEWRRWIREQYRIQQQRMREMSEMEAGDRP